MDKKNVSRKKFITQPKKKKYRNLFKFLLVLLSALVERVGVSRMQDFLVNSSWKYRAIVF